MNPQSIRVFHFVDYIRQLRSTGSIHAVPGKWLQRDECRIGKWSFVRCIVFLKRNSISILCSRSFRFCRSWVDTIHSYCCHINVSLSFIWNPERGDLVRRCLGTWRHSGTRRWWRSNSFAHQACPKEVAWALVNEIDASINRYTTTVMSRAKAGHDEVCDRVAVLRMNSLKNWSRLINFSIVSWSFDESCDIPQVSKRPRKRQKSNWTNQSC